MLSLWWLDPEFLDAGGQISFMAPFFKLEAPGRQHENKTTNGRHHEGWYRRTVGEKEKICNEPMNKGIESRKLLLWWDKQIMHKLLQW